MTHYMNTTKIFEINSMEEKLNAFEVKFDDLSINLKDVYSLMGYGSHTPDDTTSELINDTLLQLESKLRPYCSYVIKTGKEVNMEQIQIDGLLFTPGKIITHALVHAEYYAIFAVTLGEEFDHYSNQLKQKGDVVNVFVADSIGSVLAEACVSFLKDRLELESSSKKMKITNSYSPGYCDWRLSEQKKIFQLLSAINTKIDLTDSCLMIPIKSVTGIIAVGKDVKKKFYSCDICKMKGCIMRKIRN